MKQNEQAKKGRKASVNHLATIEQKAAEIQKFTLFSNAFLSVALDDRKTCEYVLRILTGNHALSVKSVKTQYTILKMVSHDAWLDVLAEAQDGTLYALEVQAKNSVDHPRRVRFYEAMIDSGILQKGRTYEELPEVCMIYICQKDFLKSGAASLEIKSTGMVRERFTETVCISSMSMQRRMIIQKQRG